MIKFIRDCNDWIRILKHLPQSEMWFSTFNISVWKPAGVSFTILSELNRRSANLIVGVPRFNPCKEPCYECYTKHRKQLLKLSKLKTEYSNIKWYFVKDVHAKFAVTGKYSLTGSRNITDSMNEELVSFSDDSNLSEQLLLFAKEMIVNAYDIGSDGPLVLSVPYKGELLANSTNINNEYKQELIRSKPESNLAKYWNKI